jgi:hypothetical protein
MHGVLEHAVDAEPDAYVTLLRLDVDVRGPLLDGTGDDPIDRFDDRRLVRADLRLRLGVVRPRCGLLEEVLG